MKKNIKLYFLFAAIISVFTVAAHGQEKPSERTLASVIIKIKEKQAARKAFIARMQQSTPVEENKTTMSPVQNANANAVQAVNTTPTPANIKPSEQALIIPVKRTAVKQ